jgi:hypothetical protein
MSRCPFLLIALAAITSRATAAQDVGPKARVEHLLERMSIEEKVGQLQQYSGVEVSNSQELDPTAVTLSGSGSRASGVPATSRATPTRPRPGAGAPIEANSP